MQQTQQLADASEAGSADARDDEQAGLVWHACAPSTSAPPPPPPSSSSTLSTTVQAKLLVRIQREIGLAADADDADDSGLSGSDSDFDE